MTDEQNKNTPDNVLVDDQFTRLFTINQRAIYLYIRSLVANSADVEEIWGETNLTLWQRFRDFEPGSNFLAWAQRIAYNKVLNFRTKKRQGIQFSDSFLERLAATASHASQKDQLYLDALKRCAEKLPDRDREILDLRYREGATCQRVAEIIGRSVNTVYNVLARVRSQLLSCIRREIGREETE